MSDKKIADLMFEAANFLITNHLINPDESSDSDSEEEEDANESPSEVSDPLSSKAKSSELSISIRPFKVSDADDLLSWASDDRVTQYLRWNSIKDREEALKYLKEIAIPHPWRRSICWGDKSIGYISVKPESGADRHRAHISYAIGVDFWGRGITTAAVKMAIPVVFQELPYLVRIEALVEDENKGSQKVLEKVGFKKEGYLRKYGFNKGEIRDMMMYSFLSTDLGNQIC